MKIKIVSRGKRKQKINEAQDTIPPFGKSKAQSTMPPMGKTPQKAYRTGVSPMKMPKKPVEKPKPKKNLDDRATHYKEFQDRVIPIVNRWFEENVFAGGTYNIDQIINAIQKDETLINRLDNSVNDGFIDNRTRDVIKKIYDGNRMVILRLKEEVAKKSGSGAVKTPYFPALDDSESDSAIDSMADTMAESIVIDVLPHLMKYLHLFANESWYGLTGQAPLQAMDALYPYRQYSPDRVEGKKIQFIEHMRKLIETALGKWITKGWTPLKSSLEKSDWMKDYDMDKKWPERSYKLRENKRTIKVKILDK